jgi:hypothetical protein
VIVLGISPGLHALAYSVLEYNGQPTAELLDADVLHAGRGMTPRDAIEIARRCRAHRLVLDIVLSRNPPGAIALGPQAEPREPPEHIAIVRLALMTLGQAFRVTVYDFGDKRKLYEALGLRMTEQRQFGGRIRTAIGGVPVSRDKRVVLATAAAVAAGLRST